MHLRVAITVSAPLPGRGVRDPVHGWTHDAVGIVPAASPSVYAALTHDDMP